MQMQIGTQGINLIKKWESFQPNVYKCPAGIDTIGYGHIVKKNESFSNGITQSYADTLLRNELKEYENAVNQMINYSMPTTQGMFDAMVSFAYNCGIEALRGSSIIRNLRRNNKNKAADSFLLWNKARINGKLTALEGLTARRKEERVVFLL